MCNLHFSGITSNFTSLPGWHLHLRSTFTFTNFDCSVKFVLRKWQNSYSLDVRFQSYTEIRTSRETVRQANLVVDAVETLLTSTVPAWYVCTLPHCRIRQEICMWRSRTLCSIRSIKSVAQTAACAVHYALTRVRYSCVCRDGGLLRYVHMLCNVNTLGGKTIF